MSSVTDGFAEAVARKRRSHEGGTVLVEEDHAVKHMRHRPCPEGKGFHAGFIIGAGMAEGNGNVRGDFFEQR